ncbi:MAG: hypothetical protein ACOCUR_00635 [Nanoarchaeota archaeon]
MIFIKILGMMDIVTALIFVGYHYEILSLKIAVYAMVYIITKFMIFPKDIASVIDILSSLLIIFMMFGVKTNLVWIAAIYFLQKGLVSLK